MNSKGNLRCLCLAISEIPSPGPLQLTAAEQFSSNLNFLMASSGVIKRVRIPVCADRASKIKPIYILLVLTNKSLFLNIFLPSIEGKSLRKGK